MTASTMTLDPAAPMSLASTRRHRAVTAALAKLLVYGVPTALILVPMLAFLVSSFWRIDHGVLDRSPTLENYRTFLSDATYWGVYLGTLRLAGLVALFGLLAGYIVAYLIWRLEGSLRYFMLLCSVIPLAMNYIVKIYAMRTILGFNGVLNTLLVWSHVLTAPSTLFVFNQTAVLITMTVIYLPFAILPIFLSLERIPPSLVEASADLGGRPGYTFRHVVLPLSLPGSIVGGLFVMVLALGDFLTPQMVGGSQGFTFGRAIWSQFGMAFDWPFGAALAVMLLMAIVIILAVAGLLNRRGRAS
ncbi:ABC transporter permease [Labrys wisconsinensis]|uniref:Spermidine/putrescine transport system permease protein n=1 Tax=Labrys wisconsinensis TaxID=425677 RepID=A0ABU0JH23_9HYPH|nr:ABC transporter permease [Labrys wisconsinensis]MDQ0472890.1 spermidine/putrescine transport system permease protein [Labrys wisconsinensis]